MLSKHIQHLNTAKINVLHWNLVLPGTSHNLSLSRPGQQLCVRQIWSALTISLSSLSLLNLWLLKLVPLWKTDSLLKTCLYFHAKLQDLTSQSWFLCNWSQQKIIIDFCGCRNRTLRILKSFHPKYTSIHKYKADHSESYFVKHVGSAPYSSFRWLKKSFQWSHKPFTLISHILIVENYWLSDKYFAAFSHQNNILKNNKMSQ